MAKGHNPGKKQSSMISVKYDHGNNNWKVSSNPYRNVGGVAETRTFVDRMAKNDK